MARGKIKFKSVNDVRAFVNIVEKCKADIDVQYGSIYLDGKSLEGLLSVQIGLELDCIIHDRMQNVQDTISGIQEFLTAEFAEK